jgi:hypothetical protein
MIVALVFHLKTPCVTIQARMQSQSHRVLIQTKKVASKGGKQKEATVSRGVFMNPPAYRCEQGAFKALANIEV